MNAMELRDHFIRLAESQRIGGKVTSHGYDLVQGIADFMMELDGISYNVEIRRLP